MLKTLLANPVCCTGNIQLSLTVWIPYLDHTFWNIALEKS